MIVLPTLDQWQAIESRLSALETAAPVPGPIGPAGPTSPALLPEYYATATEVDTEVPVTTPACSGAAEPLTIWSYP
jgi:hypothetical protein